MAKIIHSFDDVVITRVKPLIICDIDDTVLAYDYNYQHFYTQAKIMSPEASPEEILQHAEDDYYLHRIINRPFHTDYEGFMRMSKKVEELNGEIIFVTARSAGSIEITTKHFNQIQLDYNSYKVHYTSYPVISKGEYIKKYIDMREKGEVIFIDDQDFNLFNVKAMNPFIKCYKFRFQKKNV
jgi:acid phosphatase class B